MARSTRIMILAASLSSMALLSSHMISPSTAGTDWHGCPNSVNYAVQDQVEKVLGKDIISSPENFSPAQRGRVLFLIRTKYRPWVNKLPYGCVRMEWVDYLNTVQGGIEDLRNNPSGKTDFDLASELEPTLPQPPR